MEKRYELSIAPSLIIFFFFSFLFIFYYILNFRQKDRQRRQTDPIHRKVTPTTIDLRYPSDCKTRTPRVCLSVCVCTVVKKLINSESSHTKCQNRKLKKVQKFFRPKKSIRKT